MDWRYFKVMNDRGDIDTFYAPGLEAAFGLARARWPLSKQWSCVGAAAA